MLHIRSKSRQLLDLLKVRSFDLQRIVDINLVKEKEAHVSMIDENGNETTIPFYEDDVVHNAEAYDEPWIYLWVSDDFKLTSSEMQTLKDTTGKDFTHKYYHFDVEYFGHPDTDLQMSDMNTGDFGIEYKKKIH